MRTTILNHLKRNWHWWAIGLISGLYILLTWNHIFLLFDWADWDDTMQYNLSRSISEGNWLGPYNRATLIKGSVFPLWTALLHGANIPLWLGTGLLMIFSCLAIMYALRHLVNSRALMVVIYFIVLFNPMITDRAYRDLIIPQITLLVLAWAIGMFTTITAKKRLSSRVLKRDLTIFTIIGFIGLPAWFHIREDGIWLMPTVAVILLAGFVHYLWPLRKSLRKHSKQLAILLLLFALPVVAVVVTDVAISKMNQHYYGRYTTSDYFSSDFKHAYAELARVKISKESHQTIPVPYEARQKLYAQVPAFKELESCLDGEKSVCGGFKKTGPNGHLNDYEGGWLPFAIRIAVSEAGYYSSATTSYDYYTRLAKEVSDACDTGRLDCHSVRVFSMMSLPDENTLPYFTENFGNAVSFISLLPFDNNDHLKATSDKNAFLNEMAHYYSIRYVASVEEESNDTRSMALRGVLYVYQTINPILLPVSILIIGSATIVYYRHRFGDWRTLFIAWLLLLTLLLRLGMLAYIHTVSFPTDTMIYYQSVYTLTFLFEGISIYIAISLLRKNTKKKNKKTRRKAASLAV